MTAVAHLNALYSAARIILWVEDPITRDYLTRVWGDPPEIAFLISGGNASISPTVQAAEREGIGHVFGLVDRDFGRTNMASWNNPAGPRLFYLPRHEVENYALDASAIEGCGLNNRGRSVADVDTELSRLAALQPIWLACRRVLTEIRRAVLDNYPAHPTTVAMPTVAAAEQHIVGSPWFAQLPATAHQWTQPGAVLAALQAAETGYNADLASGNWRVEFSGKEIFRRVRDYVYQPPQNPGTPDSDFAKAIGEWQQANNQVPADLAQLRSALRARVGLSP
ncbi:MAG: hypothetical protein U0840_09425 [Gemmataceae bacterium]